MNTAEQAEKEWARPRQSWHERVRALAAPLRRNLDAQRGLILEQVGAIQGFMRLLMKPSNTGHAWTREEVRQLRAHLRTLVRLVPILIVFILPGSILLFPILAEILDRRQAPRE
jgi:hypothetical protein